jgi:PucR family transcriptional regulator, purine catabolism regulatory protein
MADAVLAGDGLDAIAALTAEATGGTVAVVLPAVGAAVAGAGGERRLGAVRRFVAARLAGQPGALPEGYVADAAVGRDGEKVGAVVLLDEGRPPAAGAQAVLRLAAVAALTLAALGDATADGPRAAGALLEELRRAPLEPDTLVARARRLGVDLTGGAVALRVAARSAHGVRAAAMVHDVAPGGLVLRRGDEVDALLAGDRDGAEARARAVAERLSSHAAVGFSAHEPAAGRLHAALREAAVALALVRAGEASPADAAAGAWQLLVRLAVADPPALRRLCDTSIGPALAHDADHGSDLVGTFRTYLAHGANMNAAAAAIPSHRHTVAYRLDRLRELTGLHPGSADDRERLGLGIKARLVLEALARAR